LRVPAARLMSAVDSGLQQLLHGDSGHVGLPFSSASVNSLQVAAAPRGAECEGPKRSGDVRDIERDARSNIIVREKNENERAVSSQGENPLQPPSFIAGENPLQPPS